MTSPALGWSHQKTGKTNRQHGNALVERQEDRGTVVAQGGGKVRLSSHLSSITVHRTTIYHMCSILIQPLALCFQALLPLVTESTDKGKIKAAQALAKITTTPPPKSCKPRGNTVLGFSVANLATLSLYLATFQTPLAT